LTATPFILAVISAVPIAKAVTTPISLTVATVGLELVNL
jgi:hypothetical protein